MRSTDRVESSSARSHCVFVDHRPGSRCLESGRPTCCALGWRSREAATDQDQDQDQDQEEEEDAAAAAALLLLRRRRRGQAGLVQWRRHPWRLTASWASGTPGRELWRALEMAATSLFLGIVLLVTPGSYDN